MLKKEYERLIKHVKAREIIDSRGHPTVEADVITYNGATFRASVPSGASTGIYEAHELRDKDEKRFCGKGCLKAVKNVNEIIEPGIKDYDVTQQEDIDRKMVQVLDGSRNEWGYPKQKLGANAILAVSMAVARAGAHVEKRPLYQHLAEQAGRDTSHGQSQKFVLPVPSFNVINGGVHAGNKIAFQEFMVLPTGAKSFKEAMQIGSTVYASLKQLLQEEYDKTATNVGDEGGFGAPQIPNEEEALRLLDVAVDATGYKDKVKFGMDAAASEFFDKKSGNYNLSMKLGTKERDIQSPALNHLYFNLAGRYDQTVSIEDPFDQDDFPAYKKMMDNMGEDVQIVGDDLTCSNPERIKTAIAKKLCNTLLLKVNQIGTVTEAIEAANLAKDAGWGVMVSHRSGETEDHFIADLAVGLGAGQIKSGAPCRSDRLAKYNQLLRIEEQLGENAVYAGDMFRNPWGLWK